jgi:KDO2-lipid IV(A) lauroyltransferase
MSVAIDPPELSAGYPTGRPPRRRPLALDGAFWRRTARLGARRAPAWFVRWSPPIIGAIIAAASPDMRRRVSGQLARVRGRVGLIRDAVDVTRTVGTFASCLTEMLASGSKNARPLQAQVHGSAAVDALISGTQGLIFATAHTAGWENLGGMLALAQRREVILVMQRERDAGARELQDALRRVTSGVRILHIGDDPLAPLPLVRHLREGGVVALQIDRVPAGLARRAVKLFESPGAIPEGPLRLAQLTGAPVIPVFSARQGHRRYAVHLGAPLFVPRRAGPDAIDGVAQKLADALSSFVRAHPTQWFSFHD